MKPIPAFELAQRLGGQPHEVRGEVLGFALDSRDAKPGDAFLAVKGAQVDGHRYVPQALANGAILTVAEEPVEGPHILVSNLVDALATMASSYRDGFHGPVIGVTGSAGKTTAKEFLAAALSSLGEVLKTQANRNTEYTAPLLWAELTERHRAVVVEMGMRGFGQIAHLASFSKPTIGIVTNVGWSHIDLVESRAGIARAKAELVEALPPDGVAILWADDDYLSVLREAAGARTVCTFGFSPHADCVVRSYQALAWDHAVASGVALGQSWTCRLPAAGLHMAANAACAILTAVTLGIPAQTAADDLAKAQLPPMRMEIKRYRGVTIVLDAYNAAPPSVLAALETLDALAGGGRRVAVLGEMRELGAFAEQAHRSVGLGLKTHHVDEAIFVGEPMRFALEEAEKAGVRGTMAASIDDVTAFLRGLRAGDTVLVKGSRAVALERALGPLAEEME